MIAPSRHVLRGGTLLATLITVALGCGSNAPLPDAPGVAAPRVEEDAGPAAAGDGGAVTPEGGGRCGDGRVDPGEACDDGVNDRLGGGCLPGCTGMDISAEVFAPALRTIEITLPPADWELLRHETKSRHTIFGGADCRTRQVVNPYTWYKADVRIDGEVLAQIGLRKKGHLGSQSTRRPSLKLDFNRFVSGRLFHGIDRFSVDNNKSDTSLAHTCTTYQLFTAAGIPAPRCTHARVLVNGEAQGIYTLHEDIDKDFLARHFADPSGNLYEGTASDFRPEFVGGFERETNEASPSRADIDAVMAALATGDAGLVAALDKVVDLEAFYRFWAAEVLVWHRDGYSGNSNNFFMYADPKNGGRFRFLPWGVDGTLGPNSNASNPDSVMAFSALTNRLYAIPAARDRYYAALDQLLASAWNPAALTARVAAIGAAADPWLTPAERTARASVAGTATNMINARAGKIAAARAGGPPSWTLPMRSLPCRVAVGKVSGTFSTTWGTIAQDPFASGTAAFTLVIGGVTTTVSAAGARAGATGFGRVQLVGDVGSLRYTMTVPYPDTKWFDPFSTLGPQPIVSPPHSMTIVETDMSRTPAVTLRTFEVAEGTWTFTATSTTDGQPLTGSFTSGLYTP